MYKKEELIKYISNEIKKGRWKEGDKILSESQLIDYFHVSRFTARSALDNLKRQNVIDTVKGKGSFVKSSNIKTKNYIAILTIDKVFTDNLKESFVYLLNEIKKNIYDNGYTPVVCLKNGILEIEETFPDVMSNSAGVISLYATEFDLAKFAEVKIPIVSTLHINPTSYPTVLFDYLNYYNKVISLIKKYKNILIFDYRNDLVCHDVYRDIFTFYSFNRFFERYNQKLLFSSGKKKINEKQLIKILDEIKDKPDCIVFLDDTIFNVASKLMPQYNHIFSKTKIIIYISECFDYEGKYPITKIHFSLDEMGKQTVNLLIKMINKEYISKYNIYIKPKIME